MSNLFQTGAAWLQSQMQSHAATAITYSRGGDSVSIEDATVGKTVFKVADPRGISITYERSRDYKFAAAALVLDGSQVEPQVGDEIREADAAGVVHVYAVTSINGEPHFRWADKHRGRLRVHTVEIGQE